MKRVGRKQISLKEKIHIPPYMVSEIFIYPSFYWKQDHFKKNPHLAVRAAFVSLFSPNSTSKTVIFWHFEHKKTTQTCTICRGVWNLPHKFYLYLIFMKKGKGKEATLKEALDQGCRRSHFDFILFPLTPFRTVEKISLYFLWYITMTS